MYQFAGNGGGILLDFTPDTAPAFMKAAEAQGIVDKVLWGSSTPIANTLMSSQFSPAFDGHLWIDNEFSNVDPKVGPDSALMFQVLKKYAPSIAPQAFAQMGFLDGDVRDARPAEHQGRRSPRSRTTRRSSALKNQKTDILCKPWYVGQPPVPHPEQHEHHRRLQERQRRREEAAAPTSRPSTRRSRRPASGRRSTT